MILLDRVTKTYSKEGTPALNRVSLHIEPKEFVIIVGTSGAGKSTLLKLLTREEKPTSGKIVVGGIDYDTLKDKHARSASCSKTSSCCLSGPCLKTLRSHSRSPV